MSVFRYTQRLGAYAVAVHDEQILLTKISTVGFPAGSWALPGGGVDHGESPHDAVTRELYEETGLRAQWRELIDVHDVHVVGQGPSGHDEDYHGVHLLYSVGVDPSVPLQVIDVGGTTELAEWVHLTRVRDLPILGSVAHVLDRLSDYNGGSRKTKV